MSIPSHSHGLPMALPSPTMSVYYAVTLEGLRVGGESPSLRLLVHPLPLSPSPIPPSFPFRTHTQ